MMASYFRAEQIADLHAKREQVDAQFAELRERYFSRTYNNERAREHAWHGFGRRLGLLVHALHTVYESLPPERDKEDIPERETVMNATIAIQAFVFNAFGCLDNLAWIWVYEKDVKKEDGTELNAKQVGLGKYYKRVHDSFSDQFRAYLDSREDWFKHLKGFRDSLAHRIPLYIPPYSVTPETVGQYNQLELESQAAMAQGNFGAYEQLQAEQKKVGRFLPLMTHSRFEQAHTVVFHAQLLADYVTVDEFGRTMLEELDR